MLLWTFLTWTMEYVVTHPTTTLALIAVPPQTMTQAFAIVCLHTISSSTISSNTALVFIRVSGRFLIITIGRVFGFA